jgi:hypothetical protein
VFDVPFPMPYCAKKQGMERHNRSGMPNSTQKVGHYLGGDLQVFEDSKFILKKTERILGKK